MTRNFLTIVVVLTLLFIQISAKDYAIAKYFEDSRTCEAGKEVVWGAVVANKCTNQPQGNFSKKKKLKN